MITVAHLVGFLVGFLVCIVICSLVGIVNAKKGKQDNYDRKRLIRDVADRVKKEIKG